MFRPAYRRHGTRARVSAALLGLCTPGAALAAESSTVGAKLGEPETHEQKFLIRPFIALDELSLELTRGDDALSFVPNTQLAAGLRVGYAGFTLSGSIDVEASEDPAVYGKTEYLALQAGRAFRVAERELFISAFLQYHEGMYLENSADIAPDASPIVLPEMVVLSLGLTATYYLNPEFSFDDTFIEFRPRPDTVGSWTLRLSTGLMGFDNGGVPVVPEQRRASFGDEGTLDSSSALYVGAMGGYSLDFRFFDSWCLAGSLLVGATVASERHHVEQGRREGATLAPSALFALAFGYSGETFHSGLYTSADLESSKSGAVEQALTRVAVAIFAGVRF
ncbi:MAG TPA: DUF4421 family protein [Polyangiaceae bacterium]|nr:DUF4421 family protein [Polyangiaceae bacterium]